MFWLEQSFLSAEFKQGILTNDVILMITVIIGCIFVYLQYESDELEKSVYLEYDSDSDVPDELKQDFVDENTGDVPLKR